MIPRPKKHHRPKPRRLKPGEAKRRRWVKPKRRRGVSLEGTAFPADSPTGAEILETMSRAFDELKRSKKSGELPANTLLVDRARWNIWSSIEDQVQAELEAELRRAQEDVYFCKFPQSIADDTFAVLQEVTEQGIESGHIIPRKAHA